MGDDWLELHQQSIVSSPDATSRDINRQHGPLIALVSAYSQYTPNVLLLLLVQPQKQLSS